MEYYDSFLQSIDTANSWVSDRKLRHYQFEIIHHNSFSIASPFDGSTIKVVDSHCLAPEFDIAYRCDSGEEFWLVAADLRFGYPLFAAMFEGQPPLKIFDVVGKKQPARTIEPSLKSRISDGWSSQKQLMSRVNQKASHPTIVIGHPNFAHHIWNELPALQEVLARSELLKHCPVDIVAIYEPVGPIADLINIPDAFKLHSCSATSADINANPGMATRVGSTIVSKELRQNLLRIISQTSGVNVEVAEETRLGPVFWISLRLVGRTCRNQEEFVTRLCVKLIGEFSSCVIYLDGFSYPEDFALHERYDSLREIFANRCKDVNLLADQIITAAEIEIGELARSQIVDISGASLLASLKTAGTVDYYICHAGTLQHKIGWIHNSHGYIHSCTSGITPSARRWYAAQVEDGVLPDIIPDKYVRDIEDDTSKALATRNLDYIIDPLDDAILNIISSAKLEFHKGSS